MADLFQGQTMTYGAEYEADAGAETFTIPFQPDRIMINNYTAPVTWIWYRGMPAGDAISVDGGTKITDDGFTVADTAGGVTSFQGIISAISKGDPCVVTTSPAHGYATGDLVRLSDLSDLGAVDRGMDQLNNLRFRITVLTSTTFSLQDPITGDDIDSLAFDTYVSGGFSTLESRTGDEKYKFDGIVYKVTFGTSVSGADGDQVFFEAIKFGQYPNLGDIA